MGGTGSDSGGGSRGASFGGLGMRAIFSPFSLLHLKPDAQPVQEVLHHEFIGRARR